MLMSNDTGPGPAAQAGSPLHPRDEPAGDARESYTG